MTTTAKASGVALVDNAVRWLLRVTWAALPFTVGTLIGDALSGRSRPVQIMAALIAWTAWAVGAAACLVPHPIAATALRVVAPATAELSLWWAVTGDSSTAVRISGSLFALLAALAALWPGLGQWWVNGPAYPNERRFLLKPSGWLLLGPIPAAWAVVVAGLGAGPLLLAARSWVFGGLATVLGVGAAVIAVRSLYGLSRRFVVFVPAGIVVHDLMTIRDPVLFPKAKIQRIGLATADTDALDLSQRALGLAVEVTLSEKIELTLLRPGARDPADTGRTTRFLVSPSLPGRFLAEARARRYPP